jgi:hypothetical protein
MHAASAGGFFPPRFFEPFHTAYSAWVSAPVSRPWSAVFVAARCGVVRIPKLNLEVLATERETGCFGRGMQTLSASDAKYNVGRLIDTARAEPVPVEKARLGCRCGSGGRGIRGLQALDEKEIERQPG